MTPDCVFCQIVSGDSPATGLVRFPGQRVTVFEPLNPVTPGHLLVIPDEHVPDITVVTTNDAAARCIRVASRLANPPCNIITSAGEQATQSIFHLHFHVIPRFDGDGLLLPWSERG